MPKIFIDRKYRVAEDFPSAVTLDFTAEEFRGNGNSNGLPRDALVKREFVIEEDCAAGVRDTTVEFTSGQKIRDTSLAYKLISQNSPILVRDTLMLKEGYELSNELGEVLKKNNLPVELVEPSLLDSQEEGDDGEEGDDSSPDASKASSSKKSGGAKK